MTDVINTNGIFQPTPDFEACENFKEFFIRDDSLANVSTELVFSIFERYTCKAGCDMCYVNNEWVDDNAFKKFVPGDISSEVEDKILSFFEYFEIVTTMDDLYLLKHKHPHLYDFYLRNSHLMSSTAMSDMAFIQQYNIILNEMNFNTIYEISFSDTFLNKKDDFTDKIISKLNKVHQKSPICKIKIILCEHNENDERVLDVINWAKDNDIFTDIHDDITQETNYRYDVEHADHQETNHFSSQEYLYLIKCEVVYLQFTSLFLTISETIAADSTPFFNINTSSDIADFVLQMLKAKVSMYEREGEMLTIGCNNKYRDYFLYVSAAVEINDDYNFIPRMCLKPYTKIYQRLAREGFVDTPAGLIRPGIKTPIPIFMVSSGAPKQKLTHIPIKCAD